MAVVFRCIACSKLLEAKDHLAGKPIKCAACKKVQKVPVPVAVQPVPAHNPDSSDRDEYLKFRNWLDKGELDASKSFDKSMLTLAAGALALSIAFIKDIAPTPTPDSRPFLYAAWILFAIAIGSILTASFFSQLAWGRQRKNLDLDQGIPEESSEDRNEMTAHVPSILYNPWSLWAMILNVTSLTSFIAGVAVFVSFSTCNVSGAHNAAPSGATGKQPTPKN